MRTKAVGIGNWAQWMLAGVLAMNGLACDAVVLEVGPVPLPQLNEAEPSGENEKSPRDATALAQKLHQRLVGVPAGEKTLRTMSDSIAKGDLRQAALEAMAVDSFSSAPFYRTTLKHFFSPLSNVHGQARFPLNDMTATLIGLFRDDAPFQKALFDDVLYVPVREQLPDYPRNSNAAYERLETEGADLRDPLSLRQVKQSDVHKGDRAVKEPAGLLTTRAFAEAYYSAGTNRRAVKYLLKNFLCSEMETLHDTSSPDDRVRQDIPRDPDKDPNKYHTTCKGCHSGMDGLAGAFAYLDFQNQRLEEDPEKLQNAVKTAKPSAERESHKYLRLSNQFSNGYQTFDNEWVNRWIHGKNSPLLGFRDGTAHSAQGHGPRSLGQMLGQSEAFSKCMVQKVFSHVCQTPPEPEDAAFLSQAVRNFEAGDYLLRNVFADVAAYCVR